MGVCNFPSSVLSQQKFEATDGPVLQPHVISSKGPVLQVCVIAQFYFEGKGKYILEARRQADPKDLKRREAPGPILAPLFIFLLLPPNLPYLNWASQEGCFFYLRSSLWSLDLLLFYFHGLFPSCVLATAILDSFFLL